jgi:AcrR family transcriptional regulator
MTRGDGPLMSSPRADAIRQEAVRLFAEQGYAATSMRDIASAVGLLPGSLYAHLDSKEQLLLDIIESGIDEFLDAIEPVVAAPGPADHKLRGAITTHMSLIAGGLKQTSVVFHHWRFLTGAGQDRVVEKRNLYERKFIVILEEGVATGIFASDLDLRIAVLVILGALNWAPEWFSPYGKGTPTEIGDRVADLLIRACSSGALNGGRL